MKKHYNYLNIDLDKKIHTKLKAKQGDTKSRYILVNLISNSTYYDLSDCAVDIYGIKKDKTIFFNHATVTNAKQGQFEIELTTQALAVPGEIEIQILILGTNDEKLTTFSFFIDVEKTIIDDAAIESTNEFTALTEALSSVQNIDNRFREVDEQFNTKANENEVVKKGYGTLSDFDESTRQAIQGMGSTEINAVLGDGNVIPKNLSFDTIKNQNSILPTAAKDYVRGTLSSGVLNPSNYSRIASKELIKVKPGGYFDIEALGTTYNLSFEVYDINKTYLRWVNYSATNRTIKFADNECYIRLLISKVVDGIFTPADYCDNLNFTMKENLQMKVEEFSQNIKKSNTETLKIGTYNTGKFYNGVSQGIPSNKVDEQIIKIRRTILKEKCDILCCQEFRYFADEGNTLNSYDKMFNLLYPHKWWGGSGEIIYSELATLSKKSLSSNTHQWVGDDRSLLHSVVNVNNKDIHILNCHLSWSSLETRTQQIQSCITEMKKYEYVILCGDFNVLSIDEFDLFTNNGFNLANGGYFGLYNTWTNFGDSSQAFRAIDNIIYSNNLKINNITLNNDDISDHSIFMCEFKID